MENFIVTSDSTCDLSEELIAEYGVVVKPLQINLGDKEYLDGVNIAPETVFEFVDNGGALPKTSAVSVSDYAEFFGKFVSEGKKVLHVNISSKASSCHENACAAAREVGNVWVVDSAHLSTGQGLIVIKAVELLRSGMSMQDTVNELEKIKSRVQTSFVVDRLDFLHKGGRCTMTQLIGSKIFKIHPQISMTDGALKVKRKYSGNLRRALEAYVRDVAKDYPSYDKSLCFVTHSTMDPELVGFVKTLVGELFEFDKVVETTAGVTVSSHCGRNTLGVLFIAGE